MADKIIIKNPDVVKAELDNKIVLMSIENSSYYALDSVGSEIWSLIDNVTPLSKIINTLLSQYDIDRDTCERDVLDFILDISGKRLVIIKEVE